MPKKDKKQIIINCEELETRFAMLKNSRLEEYEIDDPAKARAAIQGFLRQMLDAGYLLREGQRVSLIVYQVFSWQPDGVAISSVAYSLENGYVTSIRIGRSMPRSSIPAAAALSSSTLLIALAVTS